MREERGKALPRYVKEELRRYVRCGLLAHGFLRAVYPERRQEIVVAHSCIVFREGPAPRRAGIPAVAARVEKRRHRWLRRRSLLDERAAEERSNEALKLSPLEA